MVEVSLALADDMVRLAGLDADPTEALSSGAALDAFVAMVEAQGGDLTEALPVAPEIDFVRAERAAVVQRIDALAVGMAAWHLGAGRARKEDVVSATAGVRCLVGPGDVVDVGQPLLELHADDSHRFAVAARHASSAVELGDEIPEPRPLIIESVGA